MAKKTPPAKRKKKTMAKKSAAAVPKAAVEAQKSELPVAAPDAPRYKSFRLQKRAKPRAQSQPAKPVDGVGKIALDMQPVDAAVVVNSAFETMRPAA